VLGVARRLHQRETDQRLRAGQEDLSRRRFEAVGQPVVGAQKAVASSDFLREHAIDPIYASAWRFAFFSTRLQSLFVE
jgi:hypothetical protein